MSVLVVALSAGCTLLPYAGPALPIAQSACVSRSAVHMCGIQPASAGFQPASALRHIRKEIAEQRRLLLECTSDEECVLAEISQTAVESQRDMVTMVRSCLYDDECALDEVLDEIESEHLPEECLVDEECILRNVPLQNAVLQCKDDEGCVLEAIALFERTYKEQITREEDTLRTYADSLKEDISVAEDRLALLETQRKSMVAMLWDDRQYGI